MRHALPSISVQQEPFQGVPGRRHRSRSWQAAEARRRLEQSAARARRAEQQLRDDLAAALNSGVLVVEAADAMHVTSKTLYQRIAASRRRLAAAEPAS